MSRIVVLAAVALTAGYISPSFAQAPIQGEWKFFHDGFAEKSSGNFFVSDTGKLDAWTQWSPDVRTGFLGRRHKYSARLTGIVRSRGFGGVQFLIEAVEHLSQDEGSDYEPTSIDCEQVNIEVLSCSYVGLGRPSEKFMVAKSYDHVAVPSNIPANESTSPWARGQLAEGCIELGNPKIVSSICDFKEGHKLFYTPIRTSSQYGCPAEIVVRYKNPDTGQYSTWTATRRGTAIETCDQGVTEVSLETATNPPDATDRGGVRLQLHGVYK